MRKRDEDSFQETGGADRQWRVGVHVAPVCFKTTRDYINRFNIMCTRHLHLFVINFIAEPRNAACPRLIMLRQANNVIFWCVCVCVCKTGRDEDRGKGT